MEEEETPDPITSLTFSVETANGGYIFRPQVIWVSPESPLPAICRTIDEVVEQLRIHLKTLQEPINV